MANIGTLSVSVVANTRKLASGMRGASRLVSGFSRAATIGTAAVATGFAAAIRTNEDFNRQMTRSLAIMGDVSSAMRNDMVKAAQEVSRETQFAARDAAQAYFFLASAGLKVETQLEAMPKVARFAQAGNFDLALATDLLTDAQSALGLSSGDTAESIENLTRVSDVLVKANTLANASIQQFSEALTNKAGAALRIVGKDVEEGVAVLAAFADQGVKSSDAGTALNIVMRDMQTKAIANKAAFRAAGVSVFDARGEFRNMADVVSDLEGLLAGLSDQQKKNTLLTLGFTDKSIAFIQALIGTSDKIREYEKNLRNAGGTTNDVSNKSLTDMQKNLERVTAAWERMAQSMSKAIDVAGGFEAIAETMEGFSLFFDTLSGDREFGKDNAGQLTASEQRAVDARIANALAPKTPITDALEGGANKTASKITSFIGGEGAALLDGQLRRSALGLQQFKETLKEAEKVAKDVRVKSMAEQFEKEKQEATARASELTRRASSLLDGIQTPMDRYIGLMAETNVLMAEGLITRAEEQKILAKARDDLFQQPQRAEPLAALRADTAEGFLAARANLMPKADRVQDKQLQVQEKMLSEMEEFNEAEPGIPGLTVKTISGVLA